MNSVGDPGVIYTYTGKYVNVLDLEPDDVDIRDIAHALSQLCRFGGHCGKFYSVAEHSVYVSEALCGDAAFAGLLHDATEAYVGDVTTPLKAVLQNYRAVEMDVAWSIARHFNYDHHEHHDVVAAADQRILLNEKEALLTYGSGDWGISGGLLPDVVICGWTPERAEEEFLARFNELRAQTYLPPVARTVLRVTPPTPKPETILQEAQRLVHGDRQEAYGHPLDDFGKTATLWSVVLGHPVTEEQVALCMAQLKVSRELNKPGRDNLVDLCGYAETYMMVKEERERRAKEGQTA